MNPETPQMPLPAKSEVIRTQALLNGLSGSTSLLLLKQELLAHESIGLQP